MADTLLQSLTVGEQFDTRDTQSTRPVVLNRWKAASSTPPGRLIGPVAHDLGPSPETRGSRIRRWRRNAETSAHERPVARRARTDTQTPRNVGIRSSRGAELPITRPSRVSLAPETVMEYAP